MNKDRPRWLIFSLDLGCTLFSIFIDILIENRLSLRLIDPKQLISILFIIYIINVLVFSSIKTYKGIVRFTRLQDALRVFVAFAISSITTYLIHFFNTSRLNGFSITETEVII